MTMTDTNDLISRQDAIEALGEEPKVWEDDDLYALGARAEWRRNVLDIEAVPCAEQWIPCSGRLPEELAEVNITWTNTDPAPYYDFVKGKSVTGTAVYFKGRWYWYSSVCTDYLKEYGFSPNDEMDDAIEVIAWMPLPKPYEERKEE